MFDALRKHPITRFFLAFLLTFLAAQMGWSQNFTISGKVTKEDGTPVQGMEVWWDASTGAPTMMLTNGNGEYSFAVPPNANVTVWATSNEVPLNGVSTFDIVLVKQHITGEELLDSPYKIIAADADHSGDITWADTVDMRNLITGVVNQFPSNNSWRCVDANYVFPNPANPFATAFPELFDLNDVSSNITDLDFIAIKVGDVNNTSFFSTLVTGFIEGTVYFDQDGTCTETTGDTPLHNWKLKASGPNGTVYANTLGDGYYRIFLPPGTYDVEVLQENGLWSPCTGVVNGVVVDQQATATVDFAQQAVEECALMEVELSTFFLRRCFENHYQVSYCNKGTATANDVSVELTLDPYFTNVTSSLPWTSVNGNTYTFEVGDVPAGECGYFTIHFTLSCDAEIGQSHCTYAHISPDENCLPPNAQWSGADLVVTGECVGDEVRFTITNQGEDMTAPSDYVIIEDVMIQMSDDFQLAQGESVNLPPIAANGSTWRVEAEEVPFHPYETFASATVEGCPDGVTPASFGLVNLFPMADQKPFEDIDCQENIASYDPNDKTGFPLGVYESHFIERGQELDYLIRFQNTGTDTAFNVRIIDSLPAELDPASIELLGSSHPMAFLLEGHGIAKFIFNNIMLPDSNVNEAASHGFVKFRIAQKPDLALGTTIENEAGIYFDFNEPVITNRTLHTLGEQFLEVASTHSLLKDVELEVFPNPFEAIANFQFKGLQLSDGLLQVYDQQGSLVSNMAFVGDNFRFDGSALRSGIYFFQVLNAGRGVATGKLVVR